MNRYMDSTLLKSTSVKEEIEKLCEDAKKYEFATVCINPCYVSYASKLLKGTKVKVCTVIGFPLGANTTRIKMEEAMDAVSNGAEEIDMVINVGYLKDKDYSYIKNEIKIMTEICNETGVDFIKTSTGFGTRGASLNDIEIINKYKNDKLKVKASGGIRTKEDAEKYIKLGVSRIGTSNAVKMMEEK